MISADPDTRGMVQTLHVGCYHHAGHGPPGVSGHHRGVWGICVLFAMPVQGVVLGVGIASLLKREGFKNTARADSLTGGAFPL